MRAVLSYLFVLGVGWALWHMANGVFDQFGYAAGVVFGLSFIAICLFIAWRVDVRRGRSSRRSR